MADNGSNSVASVAIVILVIAAILGIGYFFTHGSFKPAESTKVEIKAPDTSTSSKT